LFPAGDTAQGKNNRYPQLKKLSFRRSEATEKS
jgi:hypothetical protein